MSGSGVIGGGMAGSFVVENGHQVVEGKQFFRGQDKKIATLGDLCGCKGEGISGGIAFRQTPRFEEYFAFSIVKPVASLRSVLP